MDAWVEMTPLDDRGIWNYFKETFAFRPSTHKENFPAIIEPIPSTTYSISEIFRNGEEYYNLMENDLNAKSLQAFRQVVLPEHCLFALDWVHPSYQFFPHSPFETSNPNAWQIPVLPDGDYSIFLAEDFSFGLFGHPWEQTICIFSRKLMEVFEEHRPLLFTQEVRRDGRSVIQS